MFSFRKKQELTTEHSYLNHLVEVLKRIYEINENYGIQGNAYLDGNTEIERMINKIIELKSSQIREQFLQNSDMIEFITQMNYVKDMVDNINLQRRQLEEVAASSEEMSSSIEEMSNYVQKTLITTDEAVSNSTYSIKTVNESFNHINKSLEEINMAQSKMHNVTKNAKEIDAVVDLINQVAEQTNLLALNASIEAARAGESGRGFSVVANEIKKLADSTKTSSNYIKDMVKSLRGEIHVSEQFIAKACNTFSEGKEQIDKAVIAMSGMEKSLNDICKIFEGISASVEEQSATTQEVAARVSEINHQNQRLNEACLKTGKGIYIISSMAEKLRNTALTYFKDFKGNQMLRPIAAEHLLLKWKVYNAACGFVKLDENSIMGHTSCNLGKYLEHLKNNNPSNEAVQKQYEPHKKLHALTKEAVRMINSGDTSKLNDTLRELDMVTSELLKVLK
jgi:methyl-accepting chemotaxis protein